MYCALNSSTNLCFSLVWFQVWTWYPRSNQLLTTSFAEFPPNLITLPNAAANSMVRYGRYAKYSTYRANTPKRIGRNCLSIWLKRNACSFGSICLIFHSQIHQLFISLVWVWLTGMLVRVYTTYLFTSTNERNRIHFPWFEHRNRIIHFVRCNRVATRPEVTIKTMMEQKAAYQCSRTINEAAGSVRWIGKDFAVFGRILEKKTLYYLV